LKVAKSVSAPADERIFNRVPDESARSENEHAAGWQFRALLTESRVIQ